MSQINQCNKGSKTLNVLIVALNKKNMLILKLRELLAVSNVTKLIR